MTAYLITSNGTASRYIEEAGGLPLGWFTGRDSDSVRHNTYVYALYLRCKDQNSVHRSTFKTTVAGDWLNSLILHDNDNCIADNGQTIINVDTNYTTVYTYMMTIYFTQKNFWEAY